MRFKSATITDTSFRTSKVKDEEQKERSSGRVLASTSRIVSSALRLNRCTKSSKSLAHCVDRISPEKKMAGGMDVHKNKYIEDWGTARENLEKTFRFNRRTMTLALFFGLAVPFLTYQGVTGEFHKQDMAAEKPRRKFLGSQ